MFAGANGQVIKTYLAPNDGTMPGDTIYGWGSASYAANFQVFANTKWTSAISPGTAGHNENKFAGTATIPGTFIDGQSNTILFTEKQQLCVGNGGEGVLWGHGGWNARWMNLVGQRFADGTSPDGISVPSSMLPPMRKTIPGGGCEIERATALSTGGCMVGMGDGSVRSVSTNILPATWLSALTPAGGEILGSDW